MKNKTKADKFVDSIPELVHPCRMQFDDGSVAEVTGLSVGLWQATKFASSLLANPLIVDSANFSAEKIVTMSFEMVKEFTKQRNNITD